MRRFGYDSVSESSVNCDIAVIPSIVDLGIDIGGVGRVPHVMLEKPEQGVAKEVVIFMVDIPGRANKAKI